MQAEETEHRRARPIDRPAAAGGRRFGGALGSGGRAAMRRRTRRLLKLLLLAAIFGGLWAVGLRPGLLAGILWAWAQQLSEWAQDSPALAAAAYLLGTALAKLTPVTGGGLVMVLGGYLFGTAAGGLLAAAGAALSALLVALAGRRWFGDLILDRWGERLARAEQRLLADGFNYYLAMRLLPVLPAWLVNLVPVLVPFPLRTVVAATALGVLPISLIMAGVGSGIAAIGEREAELSVQLLIDPAVLLPLAGLSLLSLLPPLLGRALARRRGSRGAGAPPGAALGQRPGGRLDSTGAPAGLSSALRGRETEP